MQNVVIIARNGGEELADKIRRVVVSDEIQRMKKKHEQQIDDLTVAHHMTEKRLSNMYNRELARLRKSLRMNWWERTKDSIATAWAIFWALLYEFKLVEYIGDKEDKV